MTARTYTEADLAKARKLYIRAWAWIDENPRAWQYLLGLLVSQAVCGKRASVAYGYECLRQKEWSTKSGERFRLNNSLKAPLARLACVARPEVQDHIELRPCALDALDPLELRPDRGKAAA